MNTETGYAFQAHDLTPWQLSVVGIYQSPLSHDLHLGYVLPERFRDNNRDQQLVWC
jgi:hypothetical protein